MIRTREYRLKLNSNFGFTLVELLIGLLLSLFIAGVALTYFVSSAQSFRAQTAESVIQENARFALEILTQNFRLAGMNPGNDIDLQDVLKTIYDENRCASGEAGLADNAIGTSACTRDGGTPNSDRFAIDYVLKSRGAEIKATGCNGSDLTVLPGARLHLASVFWTADLDKDGIRSLYCQTINLDTNLAEGVAAPLVDGVDRLQVQYALDNNKDGIIESYKSFTNLGSTNIEKVIAVRFALLIGSGLGIESDTVTEKDKDRTYKLLDAPAEKLDDYKLRNIFTTTVALPNMPKYSKY